MPGREPLSLHELERRLTAVENVVNELRPHLRPLAALLEDAEAIQQLVDDATYGRRVRQARASLLVRTGKVLGVIGAAVVTLESILQLSGHK